MTCNGNVQGAGIIKAGGQETYTCNWGQGNVLVDNLPIRFRIRLKDENDFISSGASDYKIDILSETPVSKNKDTDKNTVPEAGVSSNDIYLPGFIKSLEENILLQVEDNGNIWVVDPVKQEKHFIPNADVALDVFRKISHGFSSANMLKIEADRDSIRPELDSDKDGYKDREELENSYSPYDSKGKQFGIDKEFSETWKGKFLIRIDSTSDSDGDIWYVSKRNLKRYNFRTDNAMELFRNPDIHLGITNVNLDKIPTAK